MTIIGQAISCSTRISSIPNSQAILLSIIQTINNGNQSSGPRILPSRLSTSTINQASITTFHLESQHINGNPSREMSRQHQQPSIRVATQRRHQSSDVTSVSTTFLPSCNNSYQSLIAQHYRNLPPRLSTHQSSWYH